MEEKLLICRTVFNDYPVRIEYALTKYCLSISGLLLIAF